jgi:hypothetical protein
MVPVVSEAMGMGMPLMSWVLRLGQGMVASWVPAWMRLSRSSLSS